jgi:hypothetical protein
MKNSLNLCRICCALQYLVMASAASNQTSTVRQVENEASFVAALKDGVQIIVVKQHLDLFCAREVADNADCKPTALPYEQLVADSTRAIVVRTAALLLSPCAIMRDATRSTEITEPTHISGCLVF